MSFVVGDVVKIKERNLYGTVAAGVVAPIKFVNRETLTKDLFVVSIPDHGGLNFYAEELELVHATTAASIKEDAFRKAVELAPDALLEDQITLAEWLMKND